MIGAMNHDDTSKHIPWNNTRWLKKVLVIKFSNDSQLTIPKKDNSRLPIIKINSNTWYLWMSEHDVGKRSADCSMFTCLPWTLLDIESTLCLLFLHHYCVLSPVYTISVSHVNCQLLTKKNGSISPFIWLAHSQKPEQFLVALMSNHHQSWVLQICCLFHFFVCGSHLCPP